jgi:hypothetical protein
MTLALWLLVYLLIAFGIGKLYETTLGWQKVTYAFYPAMLVAALGRLAAAVMSNQKVGQLDLLRSSGPTRGSSDHVAGGWWFRFLYAIMPFAASVACFILMWHALDEPFEFSRRLPVLGFDEAGANRSLDTMGVFLSSLFSSFGDQRLGDWKMWLFLYCGFALIVASAPGKADLVAVGATSAGVGALIFVLGKAGVTVGARGVYAGDFWSGFSFLLAMSLFVVVGTIAVVLPAKFIRSSKD